MKSMGPKNKRRRPAFYLFLFMITSMGLLTACGSGGSGGSGAAENTDTCSLSFGVNWNRETIETLSPGADARVSDVVDCLDIAAVAAGVYTPEAVLLRGGGPWACSDHQGVIRQTPAGRTGQVVVYGRDGDGRNLYRGQSGLIALVARQTIHTGVIEAYPFVPVLSAPEDQSVITDGAVDLNWRSVIAAAGYALSVSLSADMSDPLVEATLTGGDTTFYTVNAITPGNTYFWRVRAVDAQGNRSARSAVWRFSAPAQGNATPTARIDSPADNAVFNVSETITFMGSGDDPEDGVLPGGALSWTSSLDGALGHGNVLQAGPLSLGGHIITLTAADSQGAAATDTITISITDESADDITGLWLYTADQPWSDGPDGCAPGAVASGVCRIVQTGNQFTLDFLTGWTCDPPFVCTFSGPVAGGRYVGSNSGQVDSSGGFVTNTIDFSITAPGVLAGGFHSAYQLGDYLCQWGYGLGLSFSPNQDDQPPTAVLSSPRMNDVYDIGYPISFAGSATDPEDGPLTGDNLIWTSSIDGRFGTGGGFAYSRLSAGTHDITLTAMDSLGGRDSRTVRIFINSPPAVTITSPPTGARIDPGASVTFIGSAVDPEDGPLDPAGLSWRSSIAGDLGTGNALTVGNLAYGRHAITLTAADSRGKSGSDGISLNVNRLPSVTINQPNNNSHVNPDSGVTLDATANDPEDGFLPSGAFVWTSSLDGQVAVGSYVWVSGNTLSRGVHAITCTVTDSLGDKASAGVTLVINTPPTVTIISPAPGSMEMPGSPIACLGSWTDAEDTVLPLANMVWSYQQLPTGPVVRFGTGVNATVTFSDYGTHRISFSVMDSLGDSAFASVDFESGG